MPLQQWFLKHCAHGRTIVYFHHDSRSGRARGHSKKEDQLDTSIQIKLLERPSQTETVMELSFDKHRDFYGRDAEPMIVRLSTQTGVMQWTWQSKSQDTHDRIKELLDQGWKQADIATELDLSRGRISQLVKEIRLREQKSRGGV
jgi:putative DNA primase/helicase